MNRTTKNAILNICLIASMSLAACATTENRSADNIMEKPGIEQPVNAGENKSVGHVTLTVSGIATAEGFISAALFDEKGYNAGGPVRGKRIEVTGDNVNVTFEGLPAGEYGIKLFHDIDMNGEMNTNLFGIPTEPFAFSNNASGRMGPAKWEQAKFSVNVGNNLHAISLGQ